MAEKQSLWNPAILRQAALGLVSQARPAPDGEEPRHAGGRDRQRADHHPAHPRESSAHQGSFAFNLQITLWLWFTVLFANFAEAMAEGRGKAQADTLRKAKGETVAIRLKSASKDAAREQVSSAALRAGDIIYVEAGFIFPGMER